MVDITGIPPLDITTLTLGELDYFEKRTGTTFADFGSDGTPLAGPMCVMAGLALARSGLYATRAEAMTAAEDLTLDQAATLIHTPTPDQAADQDTKS